MELVGFKVASGKSFTKEGLILSMLIRLILGVCNIQRTEHRKQMTEDKGRTVLCYRVP